MVASVRGARGGLSIVGFVYGGGFGGGRGVLNKAGAVVGLSCIVNIGAMNVGVIVNVGAMNVGVIVNVVIRFTCAVVIISVICVVIEVGVGFNGFGRQV